MTKTNVYALKLEGGKYYIGKSDDVMKRYQEHLNGGGSAWTNRHTPVALVETRMNVSAFEEDKLTKEYMSKYGIDNVRGGAYASLELCASQRSALETEIRSATDKCISCGVVGHFARDCRSKSTVRSHARGSCYRCGHTSHYANTCYARRDVNGYSLDDSADEYDDSDYDSDEY